MPPKAAAARSSFSISQDAIEIKPADLAKPLGKGGFGVVFKGTYRLAPAAIKQLLVQDDLPPEKLAEFFQEADIMATLHHPNVIQLYGYTEVKPYRIIMELMPKGSLYRVLHNKGEDLDWTQRITWGIEIGAGLHYLHTCQPVIIHRDLKSLNVLISKDNQANLTDFGLALSNLRSTTKTVTATSKKSEGIVGSLRWMAPELFSLKPKYSQASDIFALAMVLWELASREIPYSEVGDDSIIKDALKSGERADIPEDCPRILATLIQACWDQKPDQRPNAEKAVETLERALLNVGISQTSQAMAKITVKPVMESKGYAMESQVPAAASQGYVLASEVPAKKAEPVKPAAPAVSPPKPVAPAAFFAAPAKATVNQADVEKLLLHVARGEQEQAEAMLKVKGNETLLLHKGRVTDYSNRTFNSITAFQYALWALDWHMWKMILKYLPREEAAHQLQELESNGPGPGNADHGKQYDFTPLIKALKTYVDQFDALYKAQKYDALQNHWIKGVGGAQCHVPAHVANEYCRPDRPFHPKPSFTEAVLPRTFALYDDTKFYPLSEYPRGSLSLDFAIYRVAWGRGLLGGAWTHSSDPNGVDLLAISGLCEARTGQYQDLKRELTAQLAARPR